MKTNPSPLVLALTILCLGIGFATFEVDSTIAYILIFVGLLSGSLLFRAKKVFNFLVIFSAIVGTIYLTSTITLSYNQASSTYQSSNDPSTNDKGGIVTEGVTSDFFCMDALSGGEIYRASTKQKSQCKSMFKCWANAQADCLLGTSQVWYECID